MKIVDEKYCTDCGSLINSRAEICPKCGVRQVVSSKTDNEWLTTLLLCIFLGYLGVHRFYSGHIGIGIIQLLTLGGCGIWSLIDLILIVTGKFKNSDGQLITHK